MKLASSVTGALLLAWFAANAAAQPTKPAPTPAPTPTPPPGDAVKPEVKPEVEPEADDVDALRQEYLKLRDELFQSRARAATVASALYSSKITIKLAYKTGRFYGVDRATVRLDGASVYDDTQGAIADDDAVRFEGWIAPGRHVVSIRVEATGKDDERFTSATEATFVVEAVGGKDLMVVARAKDGGDIPYQWKKSESGTYRLTVDADVKTIARPESKSASTGKAAAARKTAAMDQAKPTPKARSKATPRKGGAAQGDSRRAARAH